MFLINIGIILFGIGLAFADVESAFKDAKIQPDIINKSPTEFIEVIYDGKEVNLGNELTPAETKNIPEFHYKHDGGVLYTLVLTGIILFGIGLAFADVESAFKDAKIQPDIINKSPTDLIEVNYDGKEVNLGNELTPTDTKNIPEVHYKHDGGVLYTLVLTDPDAPVRGYNREWQHWLVGNIPEDKVAKGEVLTEYVGPAPPKGSGIHRYVFLLYKQNQGAITFTERRLGARDKARSRFSIKKFAEKYNLEGPIAGNFMRAQYDDYVPTIHKQLGF